MHTPNEATRTDSEVSTTYRSIAVILALIVIMGLGYGLVDTTINAAALFTE